MSSHKAVVLRRPTEDGEFEFRIAKVETPLATQLERLIAAGQFSERQLSAFGPPLNLSEVMDKLSVRDFTVIDWSGQRL